MKIKFFDRKESSKTAEKSQLMLPGLSGKGMCFYKYKASLKFKYFQLISSKATL